MAGGSFDPAVEPERAAGIDVLYTAEQTRDLDARATEAFGIPGIVLMRRAGRAAWRELRRGWPDAGSVTLCCGRGNNAGDGYVIAGLARSAGWTVQLLQIGDAGDLGGDAGRARDWALGEGVTIETWSEGAELRGAVIVDALLGTGIRGAPRPEFAAMIDAINAARRPVVAVDLPSGLDADTGCCAAGAIQADLTVTFIGAKRGLLTGRGPELCGSLRYHDLDLPQALWRDAQAPRGVPVLRPGRGDLWIPRRAADAHKGAFGHVLVVGGDLGMGGAVCLAARAALRSGAGLVSVATRPEHVTALLAQAPEVMAHGVQTRAELMPLLERASVVVAGPGLGRAPWGQGLLDAVLEVARPRVLDADALNLLAGRPGGLDAGELIITPHPGEAARLLGVDAATVEADRFEAVQRLQAACHGVAILKGAGTLVADAEGPALNPFGNPGMASGGMGDVLAGLCAGLWAQGLEPARAARLAVVLHGLAADRAALAGQASLLASDLFAALRPLLTEVTR